MWKLKTLRTAVLIVLGGLTWNSIISWWPNMVTFILLIIDVSCIVVTALTTKNDGQNCPPFSRKQLQKYNSMDNSKH